jgi:hypothetical protein
VNQRTEAASRKSRDTDYLIPFAFLGGAITLYGLIGYALYIAITALL